LHRTIKETNGSLKEGSCYKGTRWGRGRLVSSRQRMLINTEGTIRA